MGGGGEERGANIFRGLLKQRTESQQLNTIYAFECCGGFVDEHEEGI